MKKWNEFLVNEDVTEWGKVNTSNHDKLAKILDNEFGSSHIIDGGDVNSPYDFWLTDVTVRDIIDFIKRNKNLI